MEWPWTDSAQSVSHRWCIFPKQQLSLNVRAIIYFYFYFTSKLLFNAGSWGKLVSMGLQSYSIHLICLFQWETKALCFAINQLYFVSPVPQFSVIHVNQKRGYFTVSPVPPRPDRGSKLIAVLVELSQQAARWGRYFLGGEGGWRPGS